MRFIQVHVGKDRPLLINIALVKNVLPTDAEDGGGSLLGFDEGEGFHVIESYQEIVEMIFDHQTIIENHLDRIGDALNAVVGELKDLP